MPKMTVKYRSALHTFNRLKIDPDVVDRMKNQEDVYQALNKAGYHWNSKAGEWGYHEPESANDPSPLLYIRVWADAEVVDEAADEVVERLKNFALIERSRPYPCRPPKQLESRVYLKFLPKQKAR